MEAMNTMCLRRFPSLLMLPAIILLILMSMACQLAHSRNIDLSMEARFEQWIIEHERVYKNATEKAYRFNIFKANVEFIESANAKGDLTYKLAVNQFTDLKEEEYNCLLMPMVELSLDKNHESFRYGNVRDIPKEIDWRDLKAVTPVKRQGPHCGASWAFAAVAAMEGLTKIKTGKLISLSEQQLIDCDSTFFYNGCSGGTVSSAFYYIIENGITNDTNYPYKAVGGTCDKKASTSNSAVRITNFERVPMNSELSLMKAVANQPVTVSIDASSTSFIEYRGGIFKGPCGTNRKHSATVVGYGTSFYGTYYWLLKNSWGRNWRDRGYMWMEKNIEDRRGLCGIAMAAEYPIV